MTSIVKRKIKQAWKEWSREKKKQQLLIEAQDLWEHQQSNEIGAAEMIRVDRDA